MSTAVIKWAGSITLIGNTNMELQRLSRRGKPEEIIACAQKMRAELEQLCIWLQVDMAVADMMKPRFVTPADDVLADVRLDDAKPAPIIKSQPVSGKEILAAAEEATRRQNIRADDLIERRMIERQAGPGY